MVEKVTVEFSIQDGQRNGFMAALQVIDQRDMLPMVQGFRADDYVSRREALVKFVDQMEIKLRRNEHKTNWRDQPIEALFRLLMLEIEEFRVADEFFSVAEARNELVDVANFALILFDRLGMIDQGRNRREQEND